MAANLYFIIIYNNILGEVSVRIEQIYAFGIILIEAERRDQ
jgi:hypothetical protein